MATGREVPALPTISATLGGVTYEVAPLPMRAEREWKKVAEPIIDDLLGMMGKVPEREGGWQNIPVAAVMPLVMQLKSKLLYATDIIFELVCAYAPSVAADRERIEDEAYSVEIVDLFGQIVRVVFPLDQFRMALSGRAPTPTLPNSPALNGRSLNTS